MSEDHLSAPFDQSEVDAQAGPQPYCKGDKIMWTETHPSQERLFTCGKRMPR